MELKDITTSVEPSQKLKSLKVQQQSMWYWVNYYSGEQQWGIFQKDDDDTVNEHVSAYISDELIYKLPQWVIANDQQYFLSISKNFDGYIVNYKCYSMGMLYSLKLIENIKLADALAEMYIWLIENKLVEVES